MNPTVELNLALILFLPWYAILAVLFCAYPRQPRGRARWTWDAGSLATALAATVASMHWSFLAADGGYGGMWRQVLATSVSYAVFLSVMTAAFFLRRRVLGATPASPAPEVLP